MADDDSISNLAKAKQLTSSIRFESEAVQHQVEQMLSKYQEVADIMGTARQLTRAEAEAAKDYLQTVSKIADKLGDQVDGLNEASRTLKAMELAAKGYADKMAQAEKSSERANQALKGVRKAQAERGRQVEEGEAQIGEHRQRLGRYESLRRVSRGAAAPGEQAEALGEEGQGLDPGAQRKLALGKMRGIREEVAKETGAPVSAKDARAAMRAQLADKEKSVEAAKREQSLGDKRIEQLKGQKKLADQIKGRNEEGLKTTKATLESHQKLLPVLQKRRDAEERSAKRAPPGGGGGSGGGGGDEGGGNYGGEGRRRGHGFAGSLALNLASDAGIPGISALARVERYRRMFAHAAGGGPGGLFSGGRGAAGAGAAAGAGGAAGAAEGGAAGGMMGGMGRMLASPVGIGVGLGAVTAGFGISKFREAMGVAEGMSGPQRRLEGQVGKGRMGMANAAYRQDLTEYGLDMSQSQQALISMNSQLGGREAGGQLRAAAHLGEAFGKDASEIGGEAGGLLRAGGAAPQSAVKGLEKIMIEGVKAGMDRARITEFTGEVISLQEQLLKTTGENNAAAIAKSLGQLMGASGKQGQEFLHGAAFQGAMGIDRSMQSFARGGGGMGAGTLYRAFAPGTRGDTVSGSHINLMEKMEGGLFGGKGGGQDSAAGRIKQVLGEYFLQSGAGDLFEKKAGGGKLEGKEKERYQEAENTVRFRMQSEMGVGFGQSKELLKLMDNVNAKMGSPDGQRELEQVIKDMGEKTKDPLVQLNNKMGLAQKSLQEIAVSAKAIQGFGKVKDIERTTNELAKPLVEAGSDIFVAATDSFSKSVTRFGELFSDISKGNVSGALDKAGGMLSGKDGSGMQALSTGAIGTALGGPMVGVGMALGSVLSNVITDVFSRFTGGGSAPPAQGSGAGGVPPAGKAEDMQRATVPRQDNSAQQGMPAGGQLASSMDQLNRALYENTQATNNNSMAKRQRQPNVGGAAGGGR